MQQQIMTAEQVKSKFHAEGRTFAGWARENAYSVHEVYFVLNGQRKALWGRGHEIAVKLGMKADPDLAV